MDNGNGGGSNVAIDFGTHLGVPLAAPKRGIRTDGFQNGEFSACSKIGILVPVCGGHLKP